MNSERQSGSINVKKRSSLNLVTDVFNGDERQARIMSRAYEKTLALLSTSAINPDNFSDVYPRGYLDQCAEYVNKREFTFDNDDGTDPRTVRAQIFGKVLEGLALDQINQGVWGDNTRSIATAPYDDYTAGLDGIILHRDPSNNNFVRYGVDYTSCNKSIQSTNDSASQLEEKVSRIFDDIRIGKLNEVVYFDSPFENDPHPKGRLGDLPKMVVSLDTTHVSQLAELWIEEKTIEMAKHQLFLMMLRQVNQQAEVYGIIAQRMQKRDLLRQYKQVQEVTSRLYKERQTTLCISMLDRLVTDDNANRLLTRELHSLLG